MKLSTNQQQAFNQIKEFLVSPVPVFILKGYAGTGKTFLIKTIAEHLSSRNKQFELCAPTGRAARVLTEKTGLDSQTIHKTIYKKTLSDVHSDDRLIFNFDIDLNDDSGKVFIIDESSMISDIETKQEHLRFGSGRLLYDLLLHARLIEAEGADNKIIFVGDSAQLPPINSNTSPALSKDYLKDAYCLDSEEYTLTEVFRQKGESGIIKNATKLRQAIEENNFNSILFDWSDDVIPFNPPGKWDVIAEEIKKGDAVLVSYTNASVYDYNRIIRSKYLKNDLPGIQPGDKLIVNVNNHFYNLNNGDIGTVVKVMPALTEVVNSKRINGPVTLRYRPLEIDFAGIKNNYTIIENLLYSTERELSSDESRAMYMLSYRKCGKQKPSEELKNSNPSAYYSKKREYIKAMEDSPYLSALQVKFAYAVTCHKAQGGEWNSVFVDFSGFNAFNNLAFYRWAYTAVTRASHKLFLLNTVEGSPWSKAMLKEFKPKTENVFDTGKSDPIVVYTDGSDIKGTGMIGYGVWFNYQGKEYKISGIENVNEFKQKYKIENDVSNPTMEMKALAACLKEFKDKKVDLVIKSDYKGVQKWVLGLWKINKDYIRDLVFEARTYIKSIENLGGSVKLAWVKGHQIKNSSETADERRDRIGNEKSDEVAKDRYEYNTLQGTYPPAGSSEGEEIISQPDSESGEPEIEYTAELPNDQCISIDAKVREVIGSTDYLIVKTEALQFRQRYSLKGDEDNILIMDFVYNKKSEVSPAVFKRNNVYSENEIISKLLKIGSVQNLAKEVTGEDFPKPFLKAFYNELIKLFVSEGVEILGVQHLNYLERYRFKKNSDIAYVDIYYNGKNLITKKMPSPGRPGSAALLKFILTKIPVNDGKN
ncbi:MAG: AAA family ATPase [Bacteroidota bacterium]|nr:AAA family ATPase [Bacteroidota bacterium]